MLGIIIPTDEIIFFRGVAQGSDCTCLGIGHICSVKKHGHDVFVCLKKNILPRHDMVSRASLPAIQNEVADLHDVGSESVNVDEEW